MINKPLTIWLTGLSGAGKTTLARALNEKLQLQGTLCAVLDGDLLRQGLNKDLGFSDQDRSENIRRVAEVAKLMNAAGLTVIAAFISPFQSDRELAKKIVGDQFFEVFVDTPLEICEQRDPKGLYKKARDGQIALFTGVSQAYEVPINPNLVINTSRLTVQNAVDRIIEKAFGP